MPDKVRQAASEIAFTLIAQALHRRDQHGAGRGNSGGAHDDIKIFFRAQIGGKAGFIHHVVGQPDSHIVGNHAAGAVRDIAERPGVHHGRRAFGGLRRDWA